MAYICSQLQGPDNPEKQIQVHSSHNHSAEGFHVRSSPSAFFVFQNENEMKGFIQLHREVQDNWVWDCERSNGQAWLDMLLWAAWKDTTKVINNRLFKLERGQLVASVSYLKSHWRWSDGRVRNFLKRLKNHDMIEVDSSKFISVITICNYDRYNFEIERNDKFTTSSQQTDNKLQAGTLPKVRHRQDNEPQQDTKVNDKLTTNSEQALGKGLAENSATERKNKEERIKDISDIEKLDQRLKKMGALKYRDDVIDIVDYFNRESNRDVSYSTQESLKYIVEHLKEGRTPYEIRGVIWYKIRQFTEMEKPHFIKLPTILRKEKFESNWEETRAELKRYQEEMKKQSTPNREGLKAYKIYNTGETVWM